MTFHFGTSEYSSCFLNLPLADTNALRTSTLDYLKSFDRKLWHDDPIVTLLKGEKLVGSEPVDTKNAFGDTNGRQILASPEQVEALKEHIKTYQSPYLDLRSQIRSIESQLLTEHAGFLIGNQCVDFQKQDGITEMEEATMANTVESRLNDLLLRDEQQGIIEVSRKPIYVSCVSNFTNFLDLSRKTLRSLEVGIPCIVLGRSNTSQHAFRWTELLLNLVKQHDIDPGMLTFLSCSLEDIKDITHSCQEYTGNLYTTCSRDLAQAIKGNYPNTVASTGGPNTLVTTELTKEVQAAIQMSATIESSGQCTALRHCVVPLSTDMESVKKIFDGVNHPEDAPAAVDKALFDGVFLKHKGSPEPSADGYDYHKEADAFIKLGDNLPATGINEFWRKVTVDFSRMDTTDEQQLDALAGWLNENQPISLAVNGPRKEAIKLGLALFNKTGMVVNTVGSSDCKEMPPAMTCQARPQEAEVFGEFPPRSEMHRFTKYPVVVPSSNPSYDTVYVPDTLRSRQVSEYYNKSTRALLGEVMDDAVRGFCIVLIEFLQSATRRNPKQGFGTARTTLWGLQRLPSGTKTVVRCSAGTLWDAVCPIYVLFHATNAKDQVTLSVDPQNTAVIALCEKHKIMHTSETQDDFLKRVSNRSDVFATVNAGDSLEQFPMAGQFVSLYLPLGHIKSTMPNDEEFVIRGKMSEKWLQTLF